MSEVTKRTVFADNSGGYWKFHDWAISIVPGFGTMFEPFVINSVGRSTGKSDRAAVDNTDSVRMINEIQLEPVDKHWIVMSGDAGYRLHGGYAFPRTGK